jgi:hypothetical protein
MQKLLISLSALVLVAFSARAQTPATAPQHSLKAGSIALVVTAKFSLDRWTISGNSCQGWSQQWPKNQGHSSMSGVPALLQRIIAKESCIA